MFENVAEMLPFVVVTFISLFRVISSERSCTSSYIVEPCFLRIYMYILNRCSQYVPTLILKDCPHKEVNTQTQEGKCFPQKESKDSIFSFFLKICGVKIIAIFSSVCPMQLAAVPTTCRKLNVPSSSFLFILSLTPLTIKHNRIPSTRPLELFSSPFQHFNFLWDPPDLSSISHVPLQYFSDIWRNKNDE